jgi:hypothetical protein
LKDKIKSKLVDLINTVNQTISPRKQKIIGAAATVPLIAASTMSGVCAVSCPYGIVYCPAPGQCHRYVDLDGNGQCDLSLSQVNAQSSTSSTGSSDNSSSASNSDNSSASDPSGGASLHHGTSDSSNASVTTIHDPNSGVGGNTGTDFHIIPVSLLIIGAYFFTHYLFSKGVLKPKKHKRIWNSLLMAGCIGSSFTGVLLIYMINLGVGLAYRDGLTYWHVELALLMVIVTLIHFHIYRKPFKNMFKVLFPFKSSTNKNKSKMRGTSK